MTSAFLQRSLGPSEIEGNGRTEGRAAHNPAITMRAAGARSVIGTGRGRLIGGLKLAQIDDNPDDKGDNHWRPWPPGGHLPCCEVSLNWATAPPEKRKVTAWAFRVMTSAPRASAVGLSGWGVT
jgi:hypothetical protein